MGFPSGISVSIFVGTKGKKIGMPHGRLRVQLNKYLLRIVEKEGLVVALMMPSRLLLRSFHIGRTAL